MTTKNHFKFYITLMLGVCSFNMQAQETVLTDTVRQEQNEPKIDTLEFEISGSKVVIYTNKKQDKNSVTKKTRKANTIWNGFYIGVNAYVDNQNNLNPQDPYEFMELNVARSRTYQLNIIEKKLNLYNQNFHLITGLGLHWNYYRFEKDITLVNADKYGHLNPTTPIIGITDSSRSYQRSQFSTRSIAVPLLLNFCANPSQKKSKQFSFAFGVVGNLRYSVKSKSVYNDGFFRSSQVFRSNLGVAPLSLDATVRMRIGSFSLMGNYGLTGLFLKDKGPALTPFSIGIALVNF
jgi:hypothetical protein